MGQRDEPEPLQPRGTIHHGRLVLLLRDGLEGGEDIHHEHRGAEPDVDEQRHPEGRRGIAQQRHVLISETESGRKIGQEPVDVIEDPLPGERGDDRREGPGHDEECPEHPRAPGHPVQRQGQNQAHSELADNRRRGPLDRHPERVPEAGGCQEVGVVGQTHHVIAVAQEVLVGEGVPDA